MINIPLENIVSRSKFIKFFQMSHKSHKRPSVEIVNEQGEPILLIINLAFSGLFLFPKRIEYPDCDQ